MPRKGVSIGRGTVGANVSGQPWKTSGLLTTGVAVTDGLTLSTVYKLLSVPDAESLGLNADYDVDENVVVYQHIVDFYDDPRNEGVPLWLMVVAQTVSTVDVTVEELVDIANENYAKKLIREAEAGGAPIYNLAVGFNPATGYTDTQVDGMNTDVRSAIAKAEALWAWSLDNCMEVQIVLEGRAIGGTASGALDLGAIPASPTGIQRNEHVSICIGQDYEYAAKLSGLAQKYAGIGKLLSTMAAGALNQDVGEVESMNLTYEKLGRWRKAGLSNHTTMLASQAQLDTYHNKGYIFADTYIGGGISGYRWNHDRTCTPVVIDANNNMNEHSISLGRTMNYATRMLRARLLPEIRKKQPVNPLTGLLATGAIKFLEGKGNDVFDDMVAAGQAVAGSTTVDPQSPVQEEEEVNVSFDLVQYSTVAKITGTVNNKSRIE